MSEDPSKKFWKKCSTCKASIPYGATYWICNVTTCNQRATRYVFCKVTCWDAHLPIMNHRNAWAIEKKAPSVEEALILEEGVGQSREPTAALARRITPTTLKTEDATKSDPSSDILIVASKLKAYIRTRSGMNTSSDVLETLSDMVRSASNEAILKARQDSRKTVMGRDF